MQTQTQPRFPFLSFKALAQGEVDYAVDVIHTRLPGQGDRMTICAQEGAIYITREQAKAFFGLTEFPALSRREILANRLKRRLQKTWHWIRFGTLTLRVTGTAGDNVAAEVEYIGRFGRVVGFWAYGSFDPAYPYQGD